MAVDTELGASMAVLLHRSLGQRIVAGDFDDRPFPNEADLSAQFDASRTVVREALKMLTAKGLISTRARGDRIQRMADWNLLDPEVSQWLRKRPFSIDVYREYTQMRLGVEPVAAGLTAAAGHTASVDAIADATARLTSGACDATQRLQAMIDFHHAILLGSGNTFFARLTELLTTALHMEATSTQATNAGFHMHQQILESIRHRDSAGAEAMMRELLRSRLRHIEGAPA